MTRHQALPLLRASHAVPGFTVTMLTVLLAARMGVSTRITAVLVVAVLSGQLVVGWTNELVDCERDRRVGRSDKPLATGQISVGLVRSAIGPEAWCVFSRRCCADSPPATCTSSRSAPLWATTPG